jgi:hypothetical protein
MQAAELDAPPGLHYSDGVGIVDRSIVRPVLDAINTLRSNRADLTVYYRIIDLFCARWLGIPRSEMNIEDEESIYLAHELLREYLRFEDSTLRVALWLLTINRCCRNYSADLSHVASEFEQAVQGADLDFDGTLLAPIIEKVKFFEAAHAAAGAKTLGQDDAMSSYYQWIGIYCTNVYPRLKQDPQARDRSMVSTLGFLISEFISLKENVSRMAALLLAIKQACVHGRTSDRPQDGRRSTPEDDGTVMPGTETAIVEQILERLRAESGGESGTAGTGKPLEAMVAEAAREIEEAAPETLPALIAKIERWSGEELDRDREAFRRSVLEILSQEPDRSRETARKIASGLLKEAAGMKNRLGVRIGAASGTGRSLLSRLIVLAALEAVLEEDAAAME